ncbi:hypothetical protein CYMTET_43449 [Cymbomonas tetramitiformis]|uniref:Uncharacterized protein n=1 Tax=Cymbomonas tetramitiformis TaxID=36881 RepID=A0AAE0F098_9CHLO|nr:hypothetical protein CYMTET_43449 [Cymbomonas tetramitiformis]
MPVPMRRSMWWLFWLAIANAQEYSLDTTVTAYPGYTGSLNEIQGEVSVSGTTDAAITVSYKLRDAQPGQLQSEMGAYPEYSGAFTGIGGTVTVMQDGKTGLVVEYDLSGGQTGVLSTGDLAVYPGYDGSLSVAGTVSVTQKNASAITVTYSITGANPDETAGLHVHAGMSCEDAQDHYYTGDTDAWTSTTYTADADGAASGSFDIESGYPYSENVGHAFVVHSATHRVACGVLTAQSWGMHIHEGMTCEESGGHFWTPEDAEDPWNTVMYTPDGEGKAAGSFTIESGYPYSNNTGHAFVVHGSEGRIGCGVLEALSYGMHIHTGLTCSAAEEVGGHYYSTSNDPWNTECLYTPDGEGNAEGICGPITTGYGIEMNVGHAFVVHAEEGVRVACGVLECEGSSHPPIDTALSTYPGYSGSLSGLSGTVEVAPSGCEDDLQVTYSLVGAQPGQLQSEMGAYPEYSGAFTGIGGTVTVMQDGKTGLVVEYDLSGGQTGVLSTGDLAVYPGYDGSLSVAGTVSVTQKNASAITVTYSITGANPDETAGLHVHAGMSCEDAQDHYYTGDTDAWTSTTYTADADGAASGSFDIESGYPYSENVGHAFVVHSATHRVACGVLTAQSWGMHIHEGMTCEESGGHFWTPEDAEDPWNTVMYTPDGEGKAAGSFTIESGYPYSNNTGHAFVVHGSEGRIGCGVLEALSYGMHIHTGLTCSAAEEVGGHYYSTSNDPWNTECLYTPDGEGNAEGICGPITTGYGIEMNVGHAFVVHAEEGVRVACGVLNLPATSSPTAPAPDEDNGNSSDDNTDVFIGVGVGLGALVAGCIAYFMYTYRVPSISYASAGEKNLATPNVAYRVEQPAYKEVQATSDGDFHNVL